MIHYIDSSVLLRFILNEKTSLPSFNEIETAVSSILLRVECLRTLDRARLGHRLDEDEYVSSTALFYKFQEKIDLIPIHIQILTRATQPFSIGLGTLDAIHLSSAILYRERINQELNFCTHDTTLKNAAITLGFSVLGC